MLNGIVFDNLFGKELIMNNSVVLYTVLLTEDSVNLIVKALKSLSEKKYEPGDRQGRGGLSQGEEVDSLIIDIKNQVFGE
jgi:hypothetical protein